MGMGGPIPMGFPQEVDFNKNGNGNTTTWECERLMLVGSQNGSHRLVKSHYSTLCALCSRLSHKGPQCDLSLSSATQW